MFVFKGD
jgi:predicted  nucleic acid-binding Zn-ribbon protein